jgi:hypothetical protein
LEWILKQSFLKLMKSDFWVIVIEIANTIKLVLKSATLKCFSKRATTFLHAKNPLMECGVATLTRSTANQSEMPLPTQNHTKLSFTIAYFEKLAASTCA